VRPILLAGLLAALVLSQTVITRDARADGLIYQLPADGTSVRYETEVTSTNNGRERMLQGSLTISSVGEATVDNEKCRWIEFKVVTKAERGDRITIAKFLIPETDLGKGTSPAGHILRGWLKQGEGELAVTPGRCPVILEPHMAGPAPNVKELEKTDVDSPLGKLALVVHNLHAQWSPRLLIS
jgi:hypothetical protein